MSRRQKILIIAGILIVILILLLLWFMRGTPGQNPANQPEQVPLTPPPTPEEQQAAVAERVQNAGVETVAKLFVERYGSYSTEAQFQNVRDVLPIASTAYAAELQAQIDSAPAPTEYYGVTTVILSVTVDQMDEVGGTAHAIVSTQRTESKGSPQASRVFYQSMEVSLAKEGGLWKVASSTWK